MINKIEIKKRTRSKTHLRKFFVKKSINDVFLMKKYSSSNESFNQPIKNCKTIFNTNQIKKRNELPNLLKNDTKSGIYIMKNLLIFIFLLSTRQDETMVCEGIQNPGSSYADSNIMKNIMNKEILSCSMNGGTLPTMFLPPSQFQNSQYFANAISPAQNQPVQVQPIQAQPVQAQSIQAQPVQAQPIQAQPVQTQTVQPQPIQAQPIKSQPMQTQAVQAQPLQTQTSQFTPNTAGLTSGIQQIPPITSPLNLNNLQQIGDKKFTTSCEATDEETNYKNCISDQLKHLKSIIQKCKKELGDSKACCPNEKCLEGIKDISQNESKSCSSTDSDSNKDDSNNKNDDTKNKENTDKDKKKNGNLCKYLKEECDKSKEQCRKYVQECDLEKSNHSNKKEENNRSQLIDDGGEYDTKDNIDRKYNRRDERERDYERRNDRGIDYGRRNNRNFDRNEKRDRDYLIDEERSRSKEYYDDDEYRSNLRDKHSRPRNDELEDEYEKQKNTGKILRENEKRLEINTKLIDEFVEFLKEKTQELKDLQKKQSGK